MFPHIFRPEVQPGAVQFFLCAAVALTAAAPLGPISILTIQRALSLGFRRAFWPTLGAVTANGVFGVIAALGSGALTSAIMGSGSWLRLFAAVILIAMGLRLYSLRHAGGNAATEGFRPHHLGFLYFTLAISNPLTLGFYLAAFAALGLRSEHLYAPQTISMGGGIVFGALGWFVFITLAAGKFHLRFEDRMLCRIRTGVGALLVFLGLASAVSLIAGLR